MVKKNKQKDKIERHLPCKHCSKKQHFSGLRKHENLCPENMFRRNTTWKRDSNRSFNVDSTNHPCYSNVTSNSNVNNVAMQDNIEFANQSQFQHGADQFYQSSEQTTTLPSPHAKPCYDATDPDIHPYRNWVDERIAAISASHNIFGMALDNIIYLLKDVSKTMTMNVVPICKRNYYSQFIH